MKTKIIGVTLSGNTTVYFYTCTEEALVNRNVGDRVVIPNKMKGPEDLSLSIGRFEGVNPTGMEPTGLKPIVQFLDADKVLAAKVEMLRLQAAAAEQQA